MTNPNPFHKTTHDQPEKKEPVKEPSKEAPKVPTKESAAAPAKGEKSTVAIVRGSEHRSVLPQDLEPWLKDGWVKEADVKAEPKPKAKP